MKELAKRPSQRERGRCVRSTLRDETMANFDSYFIEWAQEMIKVLVSRLLLKCFEIYG
jgi:hypothetical protein